MSTVQSGQTFSFDNVLARATCSDETISQRVQRQKASASVQIQRIDASLQGQGSCAAPNSTAAGDRSSSWDELRGVGAQFGA